MKFKGYGVVWNPQTNRRLVNFKDTPEYETNDPHEISILSDCPHVTDKSGSIEIKEEKGSLSVENGDMTKKQVMEALDFNGTNYNPRDKKEVLYALLKG